MEGERRYRGLYNAVADGVIVIDCRGAISEVNEFACKIFGYSREEIKNSLIKPIWHAINEDGSPSHGKPPCHGYFKDWKIG